jgi:glycyl-radical enzyme activating protein
MQPAASDDTLTGCIFDIQRFSIHDGPGIRTTVFLKGCPLHCRWCHNPESQHFQGELSFLPEKCVGCGTCFKVCPQGGHSIDAGGRHLLDRPACIRCGACAQECYAGALEFIGRECTVAEALRDVLKDRPFYETSGGGMTLSGGEPMAQFAFSAALLAAARAAGLHTCIETCGFGSGASYTAIAAHVDLFYFDCKESDPARHMEYTGVPLTPILDTLALLDRLGARLVLRCPVIPGLNARGDHFRAIAALANRHPNIQAIHLLPYHPLGQGKAERLGRTCPLPDTPFPEPVTVQGWIDEVAAHTRVPVSRG